MDHASRLKGFRAHRAYRVCRVVIGFKPPVSRSRAYRAFRVKGFKAYGLGFKACRVYRPTVSRFRA